MRILPACLLGFCLPLLMAAGVPDTIPDAALRLTPEIENPAPPLPPPAPLALSFGPQRLSFPGGVNAVFDQVYGSLRGFRPLTLDLYQPARGPAALPLVVFVHGGGWNGGDTRHAASFPDFPRVLAALAAKGYVVASVSYRLSGEARFPGAVQDIKAAIRWLCGQSREFNIDVTRVAVWGDAAGGQLAALVGVTCGVAPFEPESARKDIGELPSDCVQAVIDWGGATDLESLGGDNPAGIQEAAKNTAPGFSPPPTSDAGDFLGCEPARCPPMLAHLASPLGFISATSPAFLIQHGEADTEVSSRQAQKLYDALAKADVPAELTIYSGLGHDFTRKGAPDAAAQQTLQDKLASFLAATFPAVSIGPRLAQPRGSLY
jgi:acetyl esterase/lipase